MPCPQCLFILSFNNGCHVLCMNAKTFGQFVLARRINLQRFSVLFDSPILCRDCILRQKEKVTVSIPARRNNSRNRPQSFSKKTSSRFYLSRDPICMQICLKPDPCPFTRLYWCKFVLSLLRF